MVLVNPEDNRSNKTPHAGGFENPTTEYNLPLDQANAQFNLEGNIPDNLGADYAPVTPEEQAAARKSVIDAKHDRTPVSWGKRVKIGVAALAAVGAAAFGIKAATSGSSEVVPTGTPPTATETANPTTAASSAIESSATSTSIPSSSVETSPSVPASPEAVQNPDGTFSFPVELFQSNPEALGAAFIEQGFDAWSNAGATLANRQAAYASGEGVNAIPNAAKRIAAENKQKFADSLFVDGWESNPRLVAVAEQDAVDNEATIFRTLLTANVNNFPNPDNLSGPQVAEQDYNRGRPAFHGEFSTTNVTIDSQTDTQLVETINYTQQGNEEETRLADLNQGYTNTRRTGTSTVTFVQVPDKNGVLVYKISDISVADGTAGSTSTSRAPGE